jgi:hypothetical protein
MEAIQEINLANKNIVYDFDRRILDRESLDKVP